MHSIALTIDKLVKQKRGAKHYMTFTFSGFYCNEVIDSKQIAEVQLIHKETNTIVRTVWAISNSRKNLIVLFFFISQLTTMVVDVNPEENLSNRMPAISLPTESLELTSADGKLLNITSCIVQFKVKLLDMSACLQTELQLFNKASHGLISSGHYDVEFIETIDLSGQISPSKRQPAWKLRFLRDRNDLVDAGKSPLLKFHLEWSKQLVIEENDYAEGKRLSINANIAVRRVFTRSRSTGSILSRLSSFTKTNETIQCLVYQFIHNNIRQKTEVWDRLKCPWCVQRSSSLYHLLKHLSLCHDRFKFKYAPATNEIRIDVLVNKKTDDIRNDPFSRYGTKFNGTWPVKRQSRTTIHVFRPERYRPRLAEFLWNFDGNLFGRKRTYYHSYSGLVIRPTEIDENSEDEIDPLWLRQNICRLIDDFVDVNAGEKDIMKLWNLHVLANHYVCETQMSAAILSFVQIYGEQILRKNLYRNCLMHISNLSDYRLITSTDAYNSIIHLHSILSENGEIREIVVNRLKEQRKFATQPKQSGTATMIMKIPQQILAETPRRKMNQMLMRKRLRSHSLLSNIRENKYQRANDNKENMKEVMKTRAARKSAPNFNAKA